MEFASMRAQTVRIVWLSYKLSKTDLAYSADARFSLLAVFIFGYFLDFCGARNCPTARASADHREAETPTLAHGDNLTRPRQAGPTHRQVYYAQNCQASARRLGPWRGRWSAACAGWAAHRWLRACLSKRGLRTPTRRLVNGHRRRAVCITYRRTDRRWL